MAASSTSESVVRKHSAAVSKSRVKCARRPESRESRKRVTGVSATSRRSALLAMATIASRSRAKAAPQLARLSR